MPGGLNYNPGDFHEMMRNGSYIVPTADISGDDRVWQEKWLVPVAVGAVVTLLPAVINNFMWLPVIGAVLMLIGLFKLWKENGWFKAGFVFTAALVFGTVVRAVQSLFTEDMGLTLQEVLTGSVLMPSFVALYPVVALLGFAAVLCVVLGTRRFAGYMTLWVVLAPVGYGTLIALGFLPGTDLIVVARAAAAIITGLSCCKVYRMAKA